MRFINVQLCFELHSCELGCSFILLCIYIYVYIYIYIRNTKSINYGLEIFKIPPAHPWFIDCSGHPLVACKSRSGWITNRTNN